MKEKFDLRKAAATANTIIALGTLTGAAVEVGQAAAAVSPNTITHVEKGHYGKWDPSIKRYVIDGSPTSPEGLHDQLNGVTFAIGLWAGRRFLRQFRHAV